MNFSDPSGFKFTISPRNLERFRSKMSTEIQLFRDLQKDFQQLMLIGEVELFTKGGPIASIDKQLSMSMLPRHQAEYINIIGSLRLIHLQSDPKTQEYGRIAIALFEKLVQDEGVDFVEELVSLIEMAPGIITTDDIYRVSMDGHKLASNIGIKILDEDVDMVEKITRIEANKPAIIRIQAFYDIIKALVRLEKRV